jgi:hypothetical protein
MPVIVLSLTVLGGWWPADFVNWFRWVVLYLLAAQMLSGLIGTAGIHPGEDLPAPRWVDRLGARANPQPHSQPHKPDRTIPNQTERFSPDSGSTSMNADQTAPDRAKVRHS